MTGWRYLMTDALNGISALENILKKRRSIREYSEKPVPESEITKIIDLAALAPSGQNRQPWEFYAVTGREKILSLSAIVKARVDELSKHVDEDNAALFDRYKGFFTFFSSAPCLIAVAAKPYASIRTLFKDDFDMASFGLAADTTHIQSASAAVMAMLLAASERGLAACWNTNIMIAGKEISQFLNIRAPYELMCLVSLGYPKACAENNNGAAKRHGAVKILKFIK